MNTLVVPSQGATRGKSLDSSEGRRKDWGEGAALKPQRASPNFYRVTAYLSGWPGDYPKPFPGPISHVYTGGNLPVPHGAIPPASEGLAEEPLDPLQSPVCNNIPWTSGTSTITAQTSHRSITQSLHGVNRDTLTAVGTWTKPPRQVSGHCT